MKLPKPLPLQTSSIPSIASTNASLSVPLTLQTSSGSLPLSSITMPVNSLQLKINEQLVKSLNNICNHPAIFVSETDIHHLFIRDLMKIDDLNPDISLYDTNCSIGVNKMGKGSTKMYQTMLMHKEYGHATSAFSRSDFVILNEADVKTIDDPINLKTKKKWLIPDYIFEFGTEKSASGKADFIKHLKSDLKKVIKAKKQGYLIHIHRNYQRSMGERHKKNIAKFELYIESYKKEISDFLLTLKGTNISIPKIIFILIDIGGNSRIVRGKIRIIIDPLKPHCKLTRINLNSIKNELQNLV